jgi:hypothetical protein
MKQILLQFFILFAIIGGVFGFSNRAHAGTNENVAGWGWSSTIGWISLNCTDPNTCTPATNYGVNVDTTQNLNRGAISGFAWSPNIGWVSFNPSDTVSRCPTTAPAHIDLTTGVVTGWARAIAGNPSTGWDGCISLSGSNYGLTMNPTTGGLTGFAWGSTVVGWVSFNGLVTLSPNQPALSLTAAPTQLAIPGPTTLNWTSANVQTTSCSSSWAGAVAAIGTQVVTVNQTTTFTITCMGNNSVPISATATVTVTSTTALVLQANPMSVQSNNPHTDLSWTSPSQANYTSCNISASPVTSSWSGSLATNQVPNATNGYTHTRSNVTVPSGPNQSTTYTITCLNASNQSTQATAIVSVFPPTPTVSLSANPSLLPQTGGTTNLSWTATNVTSCAASANPSGWSGSKNINGGTESVGLTTTTMFTLTCQSPYSPPVVNAQATVYVAGSPLCSTCAPQAPPKPKFEEF